MTDRALWTECCGAQIDPDRRFCQRCGHEAKTHSNQLSAALCRSEAERIRAETAERRLRDISDALAESGIPGGTTIHGGVLILRERAERAEAELRERRAADQWRPIGECPRGRIVLMFGATDVDPDGRVTNWKKATGSLDFTTGVIEWDGERITKPYQHRPTHFMFLPNHEPCDD